MTSLELLHVGQLPRHANPVPGEALDIIFIEGLVAKWFYVSLHLAHHKAILGVSKTATLALARLLQQRVAGRLKLH